MVTHANKLWKLQDGLAFCTIQLLVEPIILWHPCSIMLLIKLPGQSPDVDSYNRNPLLWDPAEGMFASSSCPVGNIGSIWPRLASCRNQTLGWILDAFAQGNVAQLGTLCHVWKFCTGTGKAVCGKRPISPGRVTNHTACCRRCNMF